MSDNYSHIVFHDDIEQGTEQWLKVRSNMLSGTDAVKVRTGTPRDEILQKKAEAPHYSNQAMERGHVLEDFAIDIYSRIHECQVGRSGYITNDKYPGCMHSPDGFVISTHRRLLEVKAFNGDRHINNAELVEPIIVDQIAWGMMIGEFTDATLLLVNPDIEENRYVEIEFHIDDKLIADRIAIFQEYLARDGKPMELNPELASELSEITQIEQELSDLKSKILSSDTSDIFTKYLELSEVVTKRTEAFTKELKQVMVDNNITRLENDSFTATLSVMTRMKATDISQVPEELLQPSLNAKKALSEYYRTGIIPAGVEKNVISKFTLKKKQK